MKKSRILVVIAAAFVVLALVATPAAAQENKFKIFVAAGYISPLSSEDVSIDTVTDSLEASSEVGYDFGIEWRLNKLIGFELDYLDGKHDVEFGGTKFAETDFKPLSLSLNFHLIHTNFLDFYVGPTVSYVSWGDIKVEEAFQDLVEGSSFATDSETAFGAQVGLDIGIGSHFAIVTTVRYLQVDITPEGEDSLGVDPLIARAGAAWRW